jgi:hypothetical protein
MGWARNYTVLATNQIAGILADQAALLQQAAQYTTSDDPWTAAAYPTAPIVQVDGNFVLEDDAQVEGDRQQRLMRRGLEPYDIPAVIDPFGDYVGRVIAIQNSNRLGLGSSRNLFCYGVSRERQREAHSSSPGIGAFTMANHQILDRVQENTTSTGTGALVLGGATTQMRSFAAPASRTATPSSG